MAIWGAVMYLEGSNSGVQLSLVTEILHLRTCDELWRVNFGQNQYFWIKLAPCVSIVEFGPHGANLVF